jgi:hypothetical protein
MCVCVCGDRISTPVLKIFLWIKIYPLSFRCSYLCAFALRHSGPNSSFIPDQNVTGKWLDVRVRLSSRWSATTSSTKCFQVDHVDEVSLPDVGAKRCWVRPVCIQTRLLSHQRRERIEDQDCLIEFVQGVSWAGYVSGLFSCNNVITTFLFIWRALISQSWASCFPSHAFGNFRGQKLVACKFFELLSFFLLCYTSLSKELHWLIN